MSSIASTTQLTSSEVLTNSQDPSLRNSVSFLTSREIASSRRTNKAFNRVSHDVASLRDKVHGAKLIAEGLSNTKDPALVNSVSFLTRKELVGSRRTNKAFNRVSHEIPSLRNKANRAKRELVNDYIMNPARFVHFSKPTSSWRQDSGRPAISHQDLARLTNHLLQKGNHKSRSVASILSTPLYFINPNYYDRAFKPTDIIKMIPSKELGGLYKHMWNIIGRPNKSRAGEKAFHDQDGMKSTSAQKAEAIRLFLEDEAVNHAVGEKKESKQKQ